MRVELDQNETRCIGVTWWDKLVKMVKNFSKNDRLDCEVSLSSEVSEN